MPDTRPCRARPTSHRKVRRPGSVAVLLVGALAAVPAPAAPPPPQPVSDALRALWADARSNLLAAARIVPEAEYGHRPRPGVRSFGELVAHVADAQYFFCAAARSEPNPNEPDHRPGVVKPGSLEATVHAKAALVEAAERVVAYCDPLYAEADDDALGEPLEAAMAGQPRIRPLLLGLYHLAGHYGNLTVYLRELGHLPPSTNGS